MCHLSTEFCGKKWLSIFCDILLTNKQNNEPTEANENITSLAEVITAETNDEFPRCPVDKITFCVFSFFNYRNIIVKPFHSILNAFRITMRKTVFWPTLYKIKDEKETTIWARVLFGFFDDKGSVLFEF